MGSIARKDGPVPASTVEFVNWLRYAYVAETVNSRTSPEAESVTNTSPPRGSGASEDGITPVGKEALDEEVRAPDTGLIESA